MQKLKIVLLLPCIVMLTACASNADLSEDTIDKAPEVTEQNDESAEEDGAVEPAQADETVEDSTEQEKNDAVYLKSCNTYQDILDNAYEVIVADNGADIIPGDDTFSAVGIREAKMGRDTDEALAGIGYCFYDVDGNGIEELIIADTGPEGWNNRILLMYSLADGKPVLVIDGWARNRYYLLNDGTFYNEGSSSASCTTFATYRMDEKGIGLKVIDYYHSDSYGDSEWGWFHNTTGVHTVDERELIEFEDEDVPWKMMEDYMAQVKQLDLTFFEEMKQ